LIWSIEFFGFFEFIGFVSFFWLIWSLRPIEFFGFFGFLGFVGFVDFFMFIGFLNLSLLGWDLLRAVSCLLLAEVALPHTVTGFTACCSLLTIAIRYLLLTIY